MYDRRELPPNPPLAAAVTVERCRGSVRSSALSRQEKYILARGKGKKRSTEYQKY